MMLEHTQYRKKHLLRRMAVQRVLNGEVAAEVGRSARTIYKWLKVARQIGLEGLAPKTRTGRHRKLSINRYVTQPFEKG